MNAETSSKATVILLHGLGRTALSMLGMARYLGKQGFRTLNKSYPSRHHPIATLSELAIPPLIAQCDHNSGPIHFVTHSLGGILIRYYLQSHTLPEGSRIVMLAPPNQGSEIVDKYHQQFWFQTMNGPASQELKTGAEGIPQQLAAVPYEIGIIAGDRSFEPWFAPLFQGDHDGKVSVEGCKLPEMKDFLVVKQGHTLIMNSREVQRQVAHFLKHGCFKEKGNKS